jgi:hypothetical protein
MKAYVLPTILAAFLVIAPSETFARGANANPGGASASHMSSQGLANTNGPNAADRDKGQARAEDRRSASGLAHHQVTKHASHGKKKGTAKV